MSREYNEAENPLAATNNDFSTHVATVNGSGSQTANTTLIRAILQMGVPVSGKNLFPSNIAGLPTWFTIRVSERGYVARKRRNDVLVAMNPETSVEDISAMGPGSILILNEGVPTPRIPEDRTVYKIPFNKLVEPIVPDAKLRKLVINLVYVGVAAHVLGVDLEEVDRSLSAQLGRKPKALDMNRAAVKAGAEYAAQHLQPAPFRVERRGKTSGKILIEGNQAAALGAMFGGVTFLSWYPITPSSSLAESLQAYLERYRRDPKTGEATFAVIQAEDEIAAIGMVLGASWTGARAMTTTSGPGLSLMTEFTGFAYYAEVPAVIWDIQRVGPSTGLPTRTSQADILSAAFLSHGDTKHILLLPATVEDCYAFGMKAFDLAERFQTPIFVLSDLDIGMNVWMSEPFHYPEKPWDRGKVLAAEDLAKVATFERYRDKDGDGIPYRTLPGTDHPLAGYFTRGSGHDEKAAYTESAETYARVMDRLAKKYETARSFVPPPVVDRVPGAEVGILGFGSSHWAIVEARDLLTVEGLKTSYLLLKAVPFTNDVRSFIEACDRVYVVEQNRDAQMASLLTMEYPDLATKLRPVLHYDGLPIDAESVVERIKERERVEVLTR
ncbi:MAG: 2-oxoacid:acceptor oxidoreductase subunit alpha [Candidatus Eisenbacteria bacterium]|uniref:2-oxoacid:acceptor oxidoreductase subunit alpha n=1 Tax=Eiseniibacteriota bacterium TaxID=2212470 RepID=A0A538TJ92_UNCEI|nr:MAG: 2-oxoacid:acceptor oxidoreductase subunit alpha [Candidatus Eisenbacteria bacterium]